MPYICHPGNISLEPMKVTPKSLNEKTLEYFFLLLFKLSGSECACTVSEGIPTKKIPPLLGSVACPPPFFMMMRFSRTHWDPKPRSKIKIVKMPKVNFIARCVVDVNSRESFTFEGKYQTCIQRKAKSLRRWRISDPLFFERHVFDMR